MHSARTFQALQNSDVMLGGSAIYPFNGGGGLSNAFAMSDRWTPENQGGCFLSAAGLWRRSEL
ncbi:hypothetical protein CS542_06815 [Pedobacter sp. IW39]|nr:hypothetical protein CS542_06815 [Pedobacter sp. IW39]